MSGGILFITVIIIIAIYFYMRHTSRKRRRATDEIDTVRHYRENYLNYGSDRKRQAKQLDKNNLLSETLQSNLWLTHGKPQV